MFVHFMFICSPGWVRRACSYWYFAPLYHASKTSFLIASFVQLGPNLVSCARESMVIGLSFVPAPFLTTLILPSMVQTLSIDSSFRSWYATLARRGVRCSTMKASGYSPFSNSLFLKSFFILISLFLTIRDLSLTRCAFDLVVSLLGNR